MGIYIKSVDNDSTDPASIVILGTAASSSGNSKLKDGQIIAGGLSEKTNVKVRQTGKNNAVTYIATTTAIGTMTYDKKASQVLWNWTQGTNNGYGTFDVENDKSYELEVSNGKVTALTLSS